MLYASDTYLLLLNYVMFDYKEAWEIISKKSLSNLKWDSDIENKFCVFFEPEKWDINKKSATIYNFLNKLYCSVRIEPLTYKNGIKYLSGIMAHMFIFIIKNIYYRLSNSFIKNNNLFSEANKWLLDSNEGLFFKRIQHKFKNIIDEEHTMNVIKSYENNFFNGIQYDDYLSHFEFAIRNIFNSEHNVNVKNVFNHLSEKQELDESYNTIIGLGSLGIIYAINCILKQSNPQKYKIYFIGGTQSPYYLLQRQNIEFIYYYTNSESDSLYVKNRIKLHTDMYSPFKIIDLTNNYWEMIYYHIVKKGTVVF
jgi:hypothetical protein